MIMEEGRRLSNASHGVEEQTLQPDSTFDIQQDHEKTVSDAPEGGTRAWLVAAGSASIFFSTLGFANSFGTFEEYYIDHELQGESASKIAWIGSLASFLQFFTGMLGGPLFDRYGEKVSLFISDSFVT